MRKTLWKASVAVVVATAIALIVTTESQSAGDIPDYAAKIGGQRLKGGASWSVWLFGARHGEGCWGTRATGGGGNTTEGISCGFEVPEKVWQLVATGPISRRKSVLVLLARPKIERLDILVKHSGTRSKHWLAAQVHVIHGARAHAARLPHAVGYSAIEIPADVCPSRVRAIESGRVVGGGRLPKC